MWLVRMLLKRAKCFVIVVLSTAAVFQHIPRVEAIHTSYSNLEGLDVLEDRSTWIIKPLPPGSDAPLDQRGLPFYSSSRKNGLEADVGGDAPFKFLLSSFYSSASEKQFWFRQPQLESGATRNDSLSSNGSMRQASGTFFGLMISAVWDVIQTFDEDFHFFTRSSNFQTQKYCF
ncbi:hypothetical protein K438DRAFT_704529 [Mycena galopus ATCC 62051]|nr:hypothetical protein K438DRAFT_704529 [Mycena galopus ATCC 62051]